MFDIVVVYQHIGVMLVGGIVHLERHRAPRETSHRAPTLTPFAHGTHQRSVRLQMGRTAEYFPWV